ncbi:uncharacterized protein LOC141845347 [Curcuma longa]|uniref:uncharacterized protein LOC141845347 n=1 Tax=Curcuma longa TaxID=136217 RepID=UPI003D9DEC97
MRAFVEEVENILLKTCYVELLFAFGIRVKVEIAILAVSFSKGENAEVVSATTRVLQKFILGLHIHQGHPCPKDDTKACRLQWLLLAFPALSSYHHLMEQMQVKEVSILGTGTNLPSWIKATNHLACHTEKRTLLMARNLLKII